MDKKEYKRLVTEYVKQLKGKKSNILLILTDDQGYGDLSFKNANADVKTPNIDRLRASGVFFENGYVTAPICSPSRAGLIVGNYQRRWGAKWFGNSSFAPDKYLTIPELLKPQGYKAGYFGKVHYGADPLGSRSMPENHGFDDCLYGVASHSFGRLHYLEHAVNAIEKFGPEAHYLGKYPLYDNGKPVDCNRHLALEFTDRALNFIDKVKDENPFFCMLAYNSVHNFTWQLPNEILEKFNLPKHPDLDLSKEDYMVWYEDVIAPNLEYGRQYYLAQLYILDQQIGRILDYLEENSLREDTIIIYLTDNGGSMCNYGSNTPLDGRKYTLYEGGIRVPYIVSWPGVIEANTSSEALVSSLDILPTCTFLAGVDESTYQTDGKNLLEVLLKDRGHENLFFDSGFQQAMRQGNWKMRYVDDSPDSLNARKGILKTEHTDIGEPGYTLVNFENGLDESKEADLSKQEPEKLKELQKEYQDWLDRMDRDEH